MILGWTAGALADLGEIEAYQRLHWPKARASFEARLTAIEQQIRDYPNAAPEVEQRPGVRVVAFVNFPYRLFYQIEKDGVAILALRHTSRRSLFE
ncbi:MAG TPA: type II toxin-antitoxin system RelE/ParE family toxin [Roseiarcus sp.]|nr:type II toxin-antitoxin system RelE/ParE family toxin [Roseiarcus sp.]